MAFVGLDILGMISQSQIGSEGNSDAKDESGVGSGNLNSGKICVSIPSNTPQSAIDVEQQHHGKSMIGGPASTLSGTVPRSETPVGALWRAIA